MPSQNLKEHAIKGGATILAGKVVLFAFRLGSTAVLARLLVPADFGLVVMAMTLVAFAEVFMSGGLSMAIVQRQDVTPEVLTSLLWIYVGIGLVLGIFVATSAPLLAWIYETPQVASIALALAAMLPLGSLAGHPRAILQRRMQFGRLVLAEILATAVGVGTAITLAIFGAGVWALVALYLAGSVTLMLASWIACDWRPSLKPSFRGLSSWVRFGAHVIGAAFVGYFQTQTDRILLGRFHGADGLGEYTRAYELLRLPLRLVQQSMTHVAIATLSRVQDDPPQFRHYYGRFIEATNALTMPVVALAAVLANEIIRLILGPGWDVAADVVLALSPALFIQCFGAANVCALVPLGRPKRLFQWQLITTPLVVISFVIGLPWGPVGVAAAYSCVILILRLPSIAFLFHKLPVRLYDVLWQAVWRPSSAAVIAAGFAVATKLTLPGMGLVPRIIVVALVYAAAYAGLLISVTRGEALHIVLQVTRTIWITPGLSLGHRDELTE